MTRRAEYAACYSKGMRLQTKHFVVFALPVASGKGRLGLAVTKKSGTAVQRNRIKRVLRSFFRLHQQKLPAMDIVVTPKKFLKADDLNMFLAESDLLPLLAKLYEQGSGGGS